VAATSFNRVNPGKKYENIFIIASSHRAYFKGASIYSIGNYETPLGEVKVNTELAQQLIDDNKIFSYVPKAHIGEHSIEVQLPLLQYRMKVPFQIVPIVIGTQSAGDCKKMAGILRPFLNEKNLFIISSDFSHYPSYDAAVDLDKKTAMAIVSNDPEAFLREIQSPANSGIPELATRACGWTSILTLLYMTENRNDIEYKLLQYKNSGDTEFGDKRRVVGYNSIILEKTIKTINKMDFILDQKDKRDLLDIARATVEQYVKTGTVPELSPDVYSDNLKVKTGAFVTLNENRKLRGCIGHFEADKPLYQIVQDMAVAAATQDPRFQPVDKRELDDIEIEISVLTPMRKINSVDEIELGRDGIYIKKGFRAGTFLPQVATETGWALEQFLGHCAQDKAGIGWDGWKDADIYTYQALVFGEEDVQENE
jgi:AmmeMemoRadiSam system protein B/AmmeMemoRadiSam system protein A